MKRARGFKEITPVDAPNPVREFQGSSQSKKPSLLQPKEKILDEKNVEMGGQLKTDEVFPPIAIPPLKTSHHPSVPCSPVESDEMVDLNPFPYLYKSTYDFKFDTIKEKVLDDIKRSKNIVEQTGIQTPEKEGAYTTVILAGAEVNGQRWTPPHTWTELSNFVDNWLPQKVKKLWNDWGLSPYAIPFISESWINEHSYGSFTEGHHHQNSQISLSCYLNVPENSGRLMIKDPMEIYNHSRPLNFDHTLSGKSWRYIGVDTNDVIFFPGFLEHQTERSQSNDKRYIMSININYVDYGAFAAMNNNILKPLWHPEQFG
tara:strand:+ start:239 stop:1186 length:948 start_codon:yes stop_codon:yes gene_type:complete